MEEIARIYATSLFEAAEGRGKIDSIKLQLEQFTDALESNDELQLFLFSPYFSGEEKAAGIDRIVTDAEPEFINFLKLLAERHRLPALPRMRTSMRPSGPSTTSSCRSRSQVP